jgi:two-component system, LytTR family, response regulator
MKCVAIDDEPLALEIISSHASKVPFLELKAVFTNAFQALEYLQRETVDLIFLDIKMPDISGIDFYTSLGKRPMVIFTTAYSEHAVNSYELDAVDYLLKPFSLSRFIKACNKAAELYQLRNADKGATDYLFVKTGYEEVKILFEDILYLEASGNYVNFATKADKNILSRMVFNEAARLLPEKKFLKVHRSYIVNIAKVDRIERHQLHIGPYKIPVSEAYSENISRLKKSDTK